MTLQWKRYNRPNCPVFRSNMCSGPSLAYVLSVNISMGHLMFLRSITNVTYFSSSHTHKVCIYTRVVYFMNIKYGF